MTYGRDAWNEVFYIMERKKDAVDYVGSSFNSVSHVDMPPQCKKYVCRAAVNTDD